MFISYQRKLVTCTFLLLQFCFNGFAQIKDSTQQQAHFSGVITATNNGISLLPNFTLEKPAVLFDLSLGKGKLSFDPMLRFSMEGKPWTFIFWWRYKLIDKKQFKMSAGVHPAFAFRDITTTTNGVTTTNFVAQRYLAGEITPTYHFNKKTGIGFHYLVSHGLTKNITQYTHFIALKTILNNIKITKQYSINLIPQLYYLKMDKKEGTYVNGVVAIAKKNLPISLSSIVSKKINSTIAGKDVVWNLQLQYTFNKKFVNAK